MPPISRPNKKESRNLPAPLQSAQVQRERPKINAGDVCAGCIVWLPKKAIAQPGIRCIKCNCCGEKELAEGGYNHPVVILKIEQKKGSATVGDLVCTAACVTTFSDTPLSKYETKRRHTGPSIPIFDLESTPFSSEEFSGLVQLKLEDGRLHKQSYVRLQPIYRIPIATLRQYSVWKCRAYKRRLSEDSYALLMDLLALSPVKYEPTKTLLETKAQRLLALAESERPPVVPTQPTPQPASSMRFRSHSNQDVSYDRTTEFARVSGHDLPDLPIQSDLTRDGMKAEYLSKANGDERSWFSFTLVAVLVIISIIWWYFTSSST